MASYNRDYVTTLPLLKEKANEFSLEKWNKYEGDIGETLIKFLASTSHTVDYYFRRYLDNLLLPNDDWETKNYTWELIGYKPPYIRADYLMVQLYWPDCGLLSYVPIFMYTPFKVIADDVEYTFLAAEDYLIPPMTTRANIKLVQGKLITLNFEYQKIQGNSVKICESAIDYDLVTLNVSGENWTQVRNVYYSPNTEKIFSLHKEEDGIYLYLHSSWKSYIDTYNPTMTLYYIESDQTFDDYTEECMKISFAGPVYDTFGVDVSPFYKLYPLLNADTGEVTQPSTMEGDRVITTDDYTAKAALYPGVATCKAYSWNDSAVVREPFKVALIATGPNGALRQRTKEGLVSYLNSIGPKLLTVEVLDPSYQEYNLQVLIDIGEYRNTLADIQIRLTIKDTLEQFFALGNLQPGYNITIRELNSIILRCDTRILFVDTSIKRHIPPNPFAIPKLGILTIITEASSLPLSDGGIIDEYCQAANLVENEESGIVVETVLPIAIGQNLYERPKFREFITDRTDGSHEAFSISEGISIEVLDNTSGSTSSDPTT